MPSPGIKVATFLEPETYQRLKEVCDREDRSMSWFIKKAVETALECRDCPASKFPESHTAA